MTTKLLPDQYIKVGSINTRYWSAGTKGSYVILLHGAGGAIEIWEKNIQFLAQHHQVVAFDMVGTGLSDKPLAEYSLDYQLQFLKDFLDVLGIQKANIVGNSMGGAISLKLALDSPERVEKLVLISSLGLGQEIMLIHRLLAAMPSLLGFSRPSRLGARLMLQGNVYDAKSVPEQWIDMSYELFKLPGRQEAFISLLTSNVDIWGVRSEVTEPILNNLDRIQSQTLIIWGREDTMFPVAHAHVANKQISDSQLQIFDNCGHWAHVEYPEKFNPLVLKFLQGA
ncbi:MAG: alpha/beta fold hydrolase [Waterburya sp.]